MDSMLETDHTETITGEAGELQDSLCPEPACPEPCRGVEGLPKRINVDPKNVEKGLAKLVLTVVELIRKLLEKQALRRIEGSSLTDSETENIGEALMKLEIKMGELKEIFGLKDEELNLNLGPLGDLM